MDFGYLESDSMDDFDGMEFEFPADQTVDSLTFRDAENLVAGIFCPGSYKCCFRFHLLMCK